MQPVLSIQRNERPLAALLRDSHLNPRTLDIPARHLLYRPEDPANEVFLILDGQVRTYQQAPNGSRRIVEILGPGDWFGAAALASLERYGETAETAQPTRLSVVAAPALLVRLQDEPRAAVDLIRQLAIKLAAFREDASGLVFDDCNQRLIRTLLHLSNSAAATRSPDGVILHITHQQLAQKVGVARETISLALSELRKRNLLKTGRNQLSFQPGALRDLGSSVVKV